MKNNTAIANTTIANTTIANTTIANTAIANTTNANVNVTRHIDLDKRFLSTVLSLERANVSREAIRQITADQLKEIDSERKDLKNSLIAHFAGFTAIDGVAIANALSSPVSGADDTERKRLSRRRAIFVSCLSSSHANYDFSVEKGRHSKGIIAEYIGDEHEREAKQLLASLARVREFFPALPEISRIDLADAIRGGKVFEPIVVRIDGERVVAQSNEEYGTKHLDRLVAIAASIKGMQERAQAQA